jgi:hypothetical protein
MTGQSFEIIKILLDAGSGACPHLRSWVVRLSALLEIAQRALSFAGNPPGRSPAFLLSAQTPIISRAESRSYIQTDNGVDAFHPSDTRAFFQLAPQLPDSIVAILSRDNSSEVQTPSGNLFATSAVNC